MKKIFLSLLLLVCSSICKSQEVDVYLIGGQSNATGQGYMRNIPCSFKIDTSVMFYYSQYLNEGKGGQVWKPLCQGAETSDRFGVELSLGTRLKELYPNRKIALIKHGLSGSNLYAQWNPGNRKGEKQGSEYKKFITTVHDGLKALKAKNLKPVIKAMVWQQGEADARFDAGPDSARKYAENLKNFIEQIREEFNCEDMIFVYGTVMPMAAERFTGRELVKDGQKAVDEKSSSCFSVKNAVLVPADDLEMRRHDYHTPLPNDDVHLGTFGILHLGERFAKVIFEKDK